MGEVGQGGGIKKAGEGKLNSMNNTQEARRFFNIFWVNICISFGIAFSTYLLIKSKTNIVEGALKVANSFPLPLSVTVQPEPWEMNGYIVFWTVFFCFSIAFISCKNFIKKIDLDISPYMYLLCTLGGVFSLFFAEPDKFYIVNSWFMEYKIVLPLVFCSFLLYYFVNSKMKYKTSSRIFDILSILLLLYTAKVCYVPNPFFGTNLFHSSCFFTTIYNVYHGATLGVESQPIYGTYAYVFSPIFHFIGFSLEHYAFIIMLMCVCIMFCWLYIIRHMISNAFLRFSCLSVCLYFDVYFAIVSHHEQFITQHFPYRLFFPSVMLAYIAYGMPEKRNNLYKTLGYFLCFLAFVFNLESAIGVLFSWLSVNIIIALKNNIFEKNKVEICLQKLVKELIFAVIAFCGWPLLYIVVGYLKSGTWVSVKDLYFTQILFSQIGYGMLPLPSYLHCFHFVCLVYAVYLFISIKSFFSNELFTKKKILEFALSILGVLLLIYYMGRTHNRSLFQWLFPFIILSCVMLEYFLKNILKEKLRVRLIPLYCINALIFLALTVYSFSFVYIIKNSDIYNDFIDRQNTMRMDTRIANEITAIKKYSSEGNVNYFGDYIAPMLVYTGYKNTYLGEIPTNLYRWKDYDYILKWLNKLNKKGEVVFLDYRAFKALNTYKKKEFNEILRKRHGKIFEKTSLSHVYLFQ